MKEVERVHGEHDHCAVKHVWGMASSVFIQIRGLEKTLTEPDLCCDNRAPESVIEFLYVA